MRIELKCKCGSIAIFQDNDGMYINEEGTCDNKGRKYLIEASTDKWLDRHRRCYEGVPMVIDTLPTERFNKIQQARADEFLNREGDENEQAED